ncbi:MAG: hypothetical protein ACI90V_002978, partial [Bacillariaceae sp.]
ITVRVGAILFEMLIFLINVYNTDLFCNSNFFKYLKL